MLVSGGVCGCVVLSFALCTRQEKLWSNPVAILIGKSVVIPRQRNDRLVELSSSRRAGVKQNLFRSFLSMSLCRDGIILVEEE